jgi:6-phosphogluconolactonase (cycloisomerase 2 family)
VYVSNGGDGNIAVMKLNPETGNMNLVEKVLREKRNAYDIESDHQFLYSVRSEPFQ